jgi:hypothetical protein
MIETCACPARRGAEQPGAEPHGGNAGPGLHASSEVADCSSPEKVAGGIDDYRTGIAFLQRPVDALPEPRNSKPAGARRASRLPHSRDRWRPPYAGSVAHVRDCGSGAAPVGRSMPPTQATNLNSRLGFAVPRPNRASNPNTFGGSSAAGRFDTAAFTAAPTTAPARAIRSRLARCEADPETR